MPCKHCKTFCKMSAAATAVPTSSCYTHMAQGRHVVFHGCALQTKADAGHPQAAQVITLRRTMEARENEATFQCGQLMLKTSENLPFCKVRRYQQELEAIIAELAVGSLVARKLNTAVNAREALAAGRFTMRSQINF